MTDGSAAREPVTSEVRTGPPGPHPMPEGVERATSVLIAEDQVLLRKSLAALVDAEPDLRVVASVGTGVDAVTQTRSLRPDVVLMDIRMPELDGLTATRTLCADPALAGTRVVILTMFDLDDYVAEALRAGASGFLLKDSRPQTIVDAVRTVRDGTALLAPTALAAVIDRFRTPATPTRELAGVLTERQVEVLALVGRGLSNQEIQDALFISHGTLKTHIGALLQRLDARDRAQLVIAAYEAGLVGRP